ncbi:MULTISPECIES: hypothetical protein [Niallia]|jgi:hypothetical protein|uniref:Uncharacterized protein n=1 Tax=Niallia circulans TaxID=1397 RepID=A0A268F6G1_NIACI|nr:hypothetical protein [Niallia circulans]AYV67133.1 hypothetical protein C2I06_09740 [Niallia circulans]AYV74595.1 hypothetical protein C2H98_25185 [Niallia circulans]PAD80953.1 hypothetical protein CHH57_22610 [Niallia circulans]QJX63095.1 hypothetical protein HLK66_16510 [Niallia circulans]UQZ76806.1 hypothetical protein C2I17_20900 [Niallia circulans]
MSKVFSVLLIVLGGYYLFQKRYRVINTVLRSPFIRKYAVRILMNIPSVKRMTMNSVFGRSQNTIYQ